MDLRSRGKRRDIKSRAKRGREYHTDISSPLDAIDSGTPGEVKISTDAMGALQHLFHTSPSIQAARAILMGQLLSSGLVVRRNGKSVDLKPVFSKHLEDQWVPFARRVIDHYLVFGFVVVSLEPEDPPAFANLLGRGKEVAALSNTNKVGTTGGLNALGRADSAGVNGTKAPSEDEIRRGKAKPVVNDADAARSVAAKAVSSGRNLVPFVPVSTHTTRTPLADYTLQCARSLRRIWAPTTSPSSTSASTATAASTASWPPLRRPPTAKT